MTDNIAPDSGSWRESLRHLAEGFQELPADLRRLLQEVLARAVAAVGSAEGSILVPDGDHLLFLEAHSPVRHKLLGLRIPVEGSLAGYVYSTGQMTAVGDLQQEETSQFYEQVDRNVGVATRTYLVVPIMVDREVCGVATYVNRPGELPYRPFQNEELEQARAFTAVEGVLLRYVERSRALARLAARDFAAALEVAAPEALEGPLLGAAPLDPWLEALLQLEGLPRDDQAFCADLIALVARRR